MARAAVTVCVTPSRAGVTATSKTRSIFEESKTVRLVLVEHLMNLPHRGIEKTHEFHHRPRKRHVLGRPTHDIGAEVDPLAPSQSGPGGWQVPDLLVGFIVEGETNEGPAGVRREGKESCGEEQADRAVVFHGF